MEALTPWTYELPDDRIARYPATPRDASRLLRLPRAGGGVEHGVFRDLPVLLRPGDLLVHNDTRVMPARLRAHRATGGAVELLVLEVGPVPVRALARPARRLKDGEVLSLDGGGEVTILGRDGEAVRVDLGPNPAAVLNAQGALPLPPYLRREAEASDAERYQTVYAGPLGAAAAPTAGLHFTRELLAAVEARGVRRATLTLHVGLATFRPLRPVDLESGRLHSERFVVPEATAAAVAETRAAGGRVIAVGTTTARALEAATPPGATAPDPGDAATDLFIRPPYDFRGLDGLITNFHLPGSSLLMLVGSLVGRERLLATYATAVREGYRFYSYGDAMLIL